MSSPNKVDSKYSFSKLQSSLYVQISIESKKGKRLQSVFALNEFCMSSYAVKYTQLFSPY